MHSIYSVQPSEVCFAEAAGAARSGEHFGHQLSHLEAVDLPREAQVREDAGRAPSRSGERNRPHDPEKTGTRRYRNTAWQFPQDQRPQSTDWTRVGREVQRPAGADPARDWRAAYHGHHHRRCSQRDAAESRRASSGAGEVHRGDDFAGLNSEKVLSGNTIHRTTGGAVRLKTLGASLLSLVICASANGQTQKSTTRKKTSSGTAEQWKALEDTVAAQQKQIDELKAIVEKLAAANERAAAAGQQASEAAQRAQSAADQASQTAETAQTAAATSEKDAQHAEFSAAEAKTAIAKDSEKTSANVQSMMKSFSERIKNVGPFSFSGDIRLRGEPFFGGPADESQVRNRMRFRLRVNANAKLSDEFSGGFTLASGDINNPVSVMQTTNQMSTRKPFELDRAFLEYRPHYFKPLMLTGGKISQPWVSTELVWDKDLNPEGLAQTLN